MSEKTEVSLFEELLKDSPEIKYPKDGEVIPGTIIKIEKKNILVDINNQFTWLVVSKELWNTVDLASLKEWDKIEVMVLWDSVERWLLILSLKRANQIKSLSSLWKYFESWEVITVRPTEANKWGLLVDIDWLKWFIPVSQLTPIHYPRVEWANQDKILAHLNNLVWQDFKVKVINVADDGKKIIFSEKAAIEEKREKALQKLKEWDVIEWIVSWILTYWLFITFDWLEWLVHVSEIDRWHVNNPSKFAKIWQKIKVKIIGLDKDKISLSIKRLKDNPWDILAAKYKIWDTIRAPISRISQFWAFIELDGWIQWLIHLSEISDWIVKDIKDFIRVGQEVDVKIINLDSEQKRIGLSIKALHDFDESKAPKKDKAEEWEETPEEEPKEEKAEKPTKAPKTEKAEKPARKSTKKAETSEKKAEEKEEKEAPKKTRAPKAAKEEKVETPAEEKAE